MRDALKAWRSLTEQERMRVIAGIEYAKHIRDREERYDRACGYAVDSTLSHYDAAISLLRAVSTSF